jgi:hypothetical protein
MLQDADVRVDAGDYVEFWQAGVSVKGEFHCSTCGYGVTVFRQLPLCPMCGCESWEQTAWSPFQRGARMPA